MIYIFAYYHHRMSTFHQGDHSGSQLWVVCWERSTNLTNQSVPIQRDASIFFEDAATCRQQTGGSRFMIYLRAEQNALDFYFFSCAIYEICGICLRDHRMESLQWEVVKFVRLIVQEQNSSWRGKKRIKKIIILQIHNSEGFWGLARWGND